MTKSKTPPILFLIFNRPEKTRQSFECLRQAKPSRLYVAADGPRVDRPGEAELCAQTRAIIEEVDWPCEVHRLYRDDNLGCGRAVASAVTWFFDHEPEGVIVEDDIVLDQSFFRFSAEMLERYRDDPRITSITACNMLPDDFEYAENHSYYFGSICHVWGWASWRRAWKHFDAGFNGIETLEAEAFIERMCPIPGAAKYWLGVFKQTRDGEIDTWDYPWVYSQWRSGGYVITPRRNLMQNIGFGDNATHTTDPNAMEAGLRARSLKFPLSHPDRMVIDWGAIRYVAINHYRIKPPKWRDRLRRFARGSWAK